MAAQVGPIANEQEGLLAYLAQMRYGIKLTAYGLSPEQLRAAPSASEHSVGGLIKHTAYTEAGWIDTILQRPTYPQRYPWDQRFDVEEGETYEDIVKFYDEVAAETERVVASVSLDQPVPIDHSVPWNPQEYDNWSVRWVLLHLIEEIAQHNGHADIVRETVDGGTQYTLMAAAEGWPETDFVKPWKPAV